MTDPIIEKLIKLIAHEKSARGIGNQAEAEAFASRIQELLTRHKLSMSEVEFQFREEREPIGRTEVRGYDIGGRSKTCLTPWRHQIASAIAYANGSHCVYHATDKSTFYFIGRESDREIAKILYVYLIELGEELCTKSAHESRFDEAEKFFEANKLVYRRDLAKMLNIAVPVKMTKYFAKWMKSYRDGWKLGFGIAVAERLRARYDAAIAEADSNALTFIRRDAIAVKEALGKVKSNAWKKVSGAATGFKAGTSTGEAVNLSEARVPESRKTRLLGSA